MVKESALVPDDGIKRYSGIPLFAWQGQSREVPDSLTQAARKAQLTYYQPLSMPQCTYNG